MASVKVGIVGLPNAGKSTLFNALLKKQTALAANYPFATIEPNVGIVPVPDRRLGQLADFVEKDEGKKPPIVPATVEFVDIAGLVAGAHKGEGLGNQFLSHIREVDLIVNVVRVFEDADIVHSAGDVDHERDKEIIETELILADLATLEKQREPKGVSDTDIRNRWETIQKLIKAMQAGIPAREAGLANEEVEAVHDFHLLTMKPVLYVANISEGQLVSFDPETSSLEPLIAICAKTEEDVIGLSKEEQREYLMSIGIEKTGLDTLIVAAYTHLGLISYLTAGEKEVRAWTITKGTKAPQAAGVIHNDFERGFISAQIIDVDTLIAEGSRQAAKLHGKIRQEGKEYIVQDGDVVEFMFSV